jgi:hypothetical protein
MWSRKAYAKAIESLNGMFPRRVSRFGDSAQTQGEKTQNPKAETLRGINLSRKIVL